MTMMMMTTTIGKEVGVAVEVGVGVEVGVVCRGGTLVLLWGQKR